MTLPTLLAAADNAPEAISLQSVALVVLTAAVAYALVAIARLRRRLDAIAATDEPPDPISTARLSPEITRPREALAPDLIVAITAAVHVALDGVRHRVVSLSPAAPLPASHSPAWSVEGRRQVFQSHKVR